MRYTLLELTQNVLSTIDGDEIDSIGDTVESQQVVKIIKNVYDDILSRGGATVNKVLFNLDASGNTAKPVLMTKPNSITDIEFIRYDCETTGDADPSWQDMCYMTPKEFMGHIQQLRPSQTDVESMTHIVDGFTLTFNYKNNAHPIYYTAFNDNTLIFDAYDNTVDTTLQTSKTLCYGTKATVFTESDTFVPELQPSQFNLLLSEAKSVAWAELRQTTNQKAEQSAKRNWAHFGKSRKSVPTGTILKSGHPMYDTPNFGRR